MPEVIGLLGLRKTKFGGDSGTAGVTVARPNHRPSHACSIRTADLRPMPARTSNYPRVAIITGAANGIGGSTALAFAQASYRVVAWNLDEEAGHALITELAKADLSAEFARIDVSQAASVEAAVEDLIAEHGRVAALINNAGILRDAMLVKFKNDELVAKLGEAEFDTVIAVNLKGVFCCTQAVAPHMVRHRYGRIIITGPRSSASTATSARPTMSPPSPGSSAGPRSGRASSAAMGSPSTRSHRASSRPRRRSSAWSRARPWAASGEPADIARAYLFLADEGSCFISGAVLSVDGGMVVGWVTESRRARPRGRRRVAIARIGSLPRTATTVGRALSLRPLSSDQRERVDSSYDAIKHRLDRFRDLVPIP